MVQLAVTAEPAEIPFRQTVSVRMQTLSVDAAREHGGVGERPSPKELVLSALASCTAMTLASFLERSHLPYELSRVQVLGEWSDAGLQGLRKDLVFNQAVSPEHETVLIRVAKKCPVSQLLQQSVPLTVSLSRESVHP